MLEGLKFKRLTILSVCEDVEELELACVLVGRANGAITLDINLAVSWEKAQKFINKSMESFSKTPSTLLSALYFPVA